MKPHMTKIAVVISMEVLEFISNVFCTLLSLNNFPSDIQD